ncbi:MAG: hypothetical protein V4753_11780 [Pseudomonadota bacterium]
MIAFYSPEGAALRAMNPSRSAIAAIWFAALNEGHTSWAEWAGDELAPHAGWADTAALRFIQAVHDGDNRRAQQFWAVFASFPASSAQTRICAAARSLRASLPI